MTTTSTTCLIVTEQLYSSLGSPLCKTVAVAKEGDNIGGFIDSFIVDREPLNAPNGWVAGGPFDAQSDVVQWAWANNSLISDTDRQYAYQGRFPEKDPLQRTLQSAQPGQAFSIQGETDSNNHSISVTAGYLPSELESTLPKQLLNEDSTANLYTQLSCTGTENSLGNLGYIHRGFVRDFRGRMLAKTVVDDEGNNILSTNLYQMGAEYNSKASQPFMNETQLYLPNYYALSDDEQKITTDTNILGQNIAQNSADAGAQLNYYDVYGRLRFSQTADQAAAGAVIYYLYDALSRMIETGFINMAWNVDTFRTLTMSPNARQLAGTNTTSLRTLTYDQGVSNTFETMGKPIQVTSFNTMLSNTKIVVNTQSQLVATYSYDYLGRCTSYAQTLNGGTSYSSSYVYDSLNRLTLLSYPQAVGSANGFNVSYTYNIQASLNTIGTSKNPSAYASYFYNEFGQITQENVGSYSQYVSYTYGNTLGQLTKIRDYCGLMELDISYTDVKGNYQDGNIQQLSTTLLVNPSAQQYGCYNYTYDSFGRLTAAQGKSSDWDISDAVFDANGNLQSVQVAGQAQSYTYATPGSNQLSTALGNEFSYSASGLTTLIQGSNKVSFNYDQLSALPSQITTSTATVNIIYDAKNERYQKSVGDTSIRYLRGSNAWPLTELTTDSSSQTTTSINYIYGPKGLIMINDPSTNINYIVLKDQIGSTRIVHEDVSNVGTDSIVAYFNYLPYGELVSDATHIKDSCPIPLRYLYTGQEWDSEIGLYNYHARQYYPALGRFLTPDPAHQFANPYCYVGNNPVNFVDKTGQVARILALVADGDLTIPRNYRLLRSNPNYGIIPTDVTTLLNPNQLLSVLGNTDTLYLLAHGSEQYVHELNPVQLIQYLVANGLPNDFSGIINLLSCNSGRGVRSFAQVFQDMLATTGRFVEINALKGYGMVSNAGEIRVALPENYLYSQYIKEEMGKFATYVEGVLQRKMEVLTGRLGRGEITVGDFRREQEMLRQQITERGVNSVSHIENMTVGEGSENGFLNLPRPTAAPTDPVEIPNSYWNERFAGEEGFAAEGDL